MALLGSHWGVRGSEFQDGRGRLRGSTRRQPSHGVLFTHAHICAASELCGALRRLDPATETHCVQVVLSAENATDEGEEMAESSSYTIGLRILEDETRQGVAILLSSPNSTPFSSALTALRVSRQSLVDFEIGPRS